MGYEKDLLILPFDHRGSLLKKLYGIDGRSPTQIETADYADLKYMVYEGFLKSIEMGVPKETAAVLVDEQFGAKILADAKKRGIMTAMPTEKSGQDEFDFEFGEKFTEHIERVKPTFAKVLVRYNPEADSALNKRQLARLKKISDYCKKTGQKFIFELLVSPIEKQMEKLKGDKAKYDLELRPKLMVQAIKQIQDFGVEPDVWKLEGVSKVSDSELLVKQCRANKRTAGIITLGRGEDAEKVKEWLRAGAKVKGIIGFAVGRTVFWEPMKDLHDKKISRKEAIQQVAENYKMLVDLWNSERT
ncbi:MAG TPA: DUF2090 domain-containing protein [archaeon]|nr:DUF2090 domain-containing protein [archaeon]